MSKRFGRNQRRRARETIANLTDAREEAVKDAASWNAVADRQRARAGLLQAQIDTVRRVLGDSVALPPVECVLLEREARAIASAGLVVEAPAGPTEFFELGSEPVAIARFETMTLNVLEGGLDLSRPDALYRQPHAYIRSRETGELRYAVSPAVLAQLDQQTIVQRIAHLLAENLARDLKKGRR
jgi:hypothetical protein